MNIYLHPSGVKKELKSAYIGEYDFAKYQEVEYIQSSWTQCINTLYCPNKNTKISIDLQFTSLTVQQRLFWVWSAINSSNLIAFIAYINGSGYRSRMTFDNLASVYQSTNVKADTLRHKFVLDNTKYIIYTWDTEIVNQNNSATISYSTTPNPLALLAQYNNNPQWYENKASAKLYWCKIYESWTLVRDFVPCYRKSDNVIWLYDKVKNIFYTNSWTWTFTKWPNV